MRRCLSLILASLFICLLLAGCQHQHIWNEATCTEPKTCSKCGETEGEPLGHLWADATCTDPRTCSRCGVTEGSALGHSWTDATCTEPKTCSVCRTTEGTPLGHSVDEWTLVSESTCSEAGTQQGICSRCGEEVSQELPLLEHTPGDWEIEQEATIDLPGTRDVPYAAQR